MAVDIVLEDTRWKDVGLEGLAERAIPAVLARLSVDTAAEIAVLACDDARIATLNADFRGKPVPTNVLSWPAQELSPEIPGESPHPPVPDRHGDLELGDIAIAFETCSREAAVAGKPLEEHVIHLIVHGVLHLLGYDHENDADAARMEALEVTILAGLGLENPYIVADGA